MKGQEKFNRFIERFPHDHTFFFNRPHWTRRNFFQWMGGGVVGSYLAKDLAAQVVTQNPVTPANKAKNCIFILLAGAPSHTDTFDLKVISGTTPSSFNPAKIGDILWPAGLMPKLADHVNEMAIVRSVRTWALQHTLGQTWLQVGRNPAGVLGAIAPNIGSIVAIEKAKERKKSDSFPTFLALNSGNAIGSGYLAASYAPIKFDPAASGFPDTKNPDGETRFNQKWDLLHKLDGKLRTASPYGKALQDYDEFYDAGKAMMFNPVVDAAFRFDATESARYGTSGFGNACLVANKVLAANAGTRYVQITFGSWDHHQNIYGANNLPRMATQFDAGLSTLLADMKKNGTLDETLVVVMGEFGRTVGALTGQGGRDHFLQQFVMFAGGGVKGGRAIGTTDDTGSATVDPGWSGNRDVKPEDVEATIYSALGINWTTVRYDDPFKRGFEYVPKVNNDDAYAPISEIWK